MDRIVEGLNLMQSYILRLTKGPSDQVFIVEGFFIILYKNKGEEGVFGILCFFYYYFQKLMKRKEAINKPLKAKSVEINHKKSSTKPKSRSKEISREQPDLFVLVGDNFYAASTKSERKIYEKFQHKLKTSTSSLKKVKSRSINHYQDPINLQQYVKNLTKEEKEKLLKDLSKQIDQQPPKQFTEEQERDEKMMRLTEKLESLRQELTIRWDEQIRKINHTFQNQDISLEEKNEKIALIQKIKENKIAMINHTQLLFQKIFKEEPDIQLEKSQRMQNIINSLNSISSLDPRDHLHQQEHRNILQQISIINTQPSVRLPPLFEEIVQKEDNQRQLHLNKLSNIISVNDDVRIQEFQKPNILNKQSLKLDIRLDDVQFGRDHYDDDQPSESNSATKQQQKERQIIKLQFFKGEPQKEKKQSSPDDQFLCVGEQRHQIQIPLLMTKDRLEQLQLQKSAKEIQGLIVGIKQRQQFQLNEIHSINNYHFTTLIDINEFLQRFYEFLIRNYSRQIIQGLNSPFGKSCLDKLQSLRKQNLTPQYENRNILPEQYLDRFYYELKQAGCQIKEEAKIFNKAIFHTFNTELNVYRPYYELDGEIFSWNISEKGLTFYQINDENLSEVFQKAKGKVLQYSASLCGLMPNCELTTAQAKNLLTKKNEEQIQRVICSEMVQNFGKWSIAIVNFEAMERLTWFKQILQREMDLACEQLKEFKIRK